MTRGGPWMTRGGQRTTCGGGPTGFRRLPNNRMNQNYLQSDLDAVTLFLIFCLDTYKGPAEKGFYVFSDVGVSSPIVRRVSERKS